MGFSTPKPQQPKNTPTRLDSEAVTEATDERRRLRAGSGIVSSFLGGAAGEPGVVGKLGLTGRV